MADPKVIRINKEDVHNPSFGIQILEDGSWIRGGAPVKGALLFSVRAATLEEAVSLAREEYNKHAEVIKQKLEELKVRRVVDGVEINRNWVERKMKGHVHFSRQSNTSHAHPDGVALCIDLPGGSSVRAELSQQQFLDLLTNHYFETEVVVQRPIAIYKDIEPGGESFIWEKPEDDHRQTRDIMKDVLGVEEITTMIAEKAKHRNWTRVSAHFTFRHNEIEVAVFEA